MEADRDRPPGIATPDCSGHSFEPRFGRGRVRWHGAVRVLVAEIPAPDAGVAGEGLGGGARQPLLCVDERRVAVPVAQAGLGRQGHSVADDSKTLVTRGSAHGPAGNPVDAAHVAGEERDEQVDAGLRCSVRGVDEVADDRPVDGGRRRLGVLPAHEDPDRVEAGAAGGREIVASDRRLVGSQPVHRLRGGPVVDAEHERLGLDRAQEITCS